MKLLRTRIEALETKDGEGGRPQIDLSGVSDIEIEVYRSACTEVSASAITAAEAAELCGLATAGVLHPYPLRGEPSFSLPRRLHVLIGGTISRVRWFGFPGHRPLGWERYLYVGPAGELRRTNGAAVYPPG
jgi:hypothetical protein